MAEENNIPKVYDPAAVEKKWYAYWIEHGFFHQPVDKSRKPFSVVIPPPNITGKLHMGCRAMTMRVWPPRSRWKKN